MILETNTRSYKKSIYVATIISYDSYEHVSYHETEQGARDKLAKALLEFKKDTLQHFNWRVQNGRELNWSSEFTRVLSVTSYNVFEKELEQ